MWLRSNRVLVGILIILTAPLFFILERIGFFGWSGVRGMISVVYLVVGSALVVAGVLFSRKK
ncbi:hypothetical protein LCM20_07965 [Halobacillus litoralis]|uniref:hypothetical protein n=1 Tax=Halobacillus litoralis TaxID=45668 RepID=UPI001CD662DF|nr:hypothetical protein [Halobacillus litoralis]MCA0970517.1 hypothetical protein [Halobacillus litoralis]